MNKEKNKILSDIYHHQGQSGSFQSRDKIRQAVKRAGYTGISDADIESFLLKTESYVRFRQKGRRSFPKHLPTRVTLSSGPNYTWFADSLYFLSGGWRTPYRYGQVYVDFFTKRIFGRLLVKLNAKSSVRAFTSIVEEDNDGVFPSTLVIDRGSEWQKEFGTFAKDNSVKLIKTTANQANKSFLAERAIRTVRLILKRIHATGERDLQKSFNAALSGYNKSENTLTKVPPEDGDKKENFEKIFLSLEKRRYGILEKTLKESDKLNKILKVGQLVRKRIVKVPFAKESTDTWTSELYQITDILLTEPLFSYKLADANTNIGIPGTYTFFDLLQNG